MEYQCNICGKDFNWKRNLNAHIKKSHPESLTCKEAKYKCSACMKDYYSRASFYRHKKEHEFPVFNILLTNSDNPEDKFSCEEQDCSVKCSSLLKLREHMLVMHGDKFKMQFLEFTNSTEFEEWKEQIEITEKCNFLSRHSKKQKNCLYRNYSCNRAGASLKRSQRQYRMKATGYCKIDGNCTASMTAYIYSEGHVKVKYIPFHFGHDMERKFLRIRKSERKSIEEKLLNGVPRSQILKDCHENSHLNSCLRLMTASKLSHMERKLGVKNSRIRDNFYKLKALINQYNDNSGDYEFHLKCEDDDSSIDFLSRQDFVCILFTKKQIEWAQNFFGNLVYMKSTIETKLNPYPLTSVSVVDQYGRVVPVGWMLSNEVNMRTVTYFLMKLKLSLKSAYSLPSYFMSDCNSIFHEAWISVFGGSSKKLLCTWHVKILWQGKLKLIKNDAVRKEIHSRLLVLLDCTEKESFDSSLEVLLETMQSFEEASDFEEYFTKHWLPCADEWALCSRMGFRVNSDIYLESFHKKFKNQGLEKNCSSLDRYLKYLIQFTATLEQDYSILTKMPPMLEMIQKHHAEACQVKEILFCGLGRWIVSSCSTDGIYYQVIKEQPNCNVLCEQKCEDCQVCVHLFQCTCLDWAKSGTICKHIHAVCIDELNQTVGTIAQEIEVPMMEIEDVNLSKRLLLRQKALEFVSILDNADDIDNPEVQKTLKTSVSELSNLLKYS